MHLYICAPFADLVDGHSYQCKEKSSSRFFSYNSVGKQMQEIFFSWILSAVP